MIRTILKTSLILCTFVLLRGSVNAQEGGYLSSLSPTIGETLKFYISSSVTSFDLDIYRLGQVKQKVMTIRSVSGGIQPVSDSAYSYGCNWLPTAEIVVPPSWNTGVYEADFPTTTGLHKLIFVVKSQSLGSTSKTLVCLTVNTWQAYNNWGGKSVYNYNSTNTKAAVKVSFNRPFSDSTEILYFRWEDKLVKWLEKEKTNVEFCTRIDLDRDPSILDHYTTLVIAGHDEYWSRPERNATQNLVNRGGRVIILSGNTCWWQVRFEDSLKTMVCYKDAELDPLFSKNDSIVTTQWSSDVVHDGESSLTGVTFLHGGYVNKDTVYPQAKGYGGYTVLHSNSWIYDKTNLHNGDVFGQADPIVGYEVDGAAWLWSKDSMIQLLPWATAKKDASPSNFSILGLSPAADASGGLIGSATMGYYTTPNGGAVFNAATTDWANGLDGRDPIVEQITRNVFNRFISKTSFPPVLLSYTPRTFTADTVNHQFIYASHRVVYCPRNMQDTFVVHAVDPMNKPLTYTWKKGGFYAGNDSSVVLNFGPNGCNNAPVFVSIVISNGTDSVSGGWWVIDTNIVFITLPPFFPYKNHNPFFYKPVAVSTVDESPRCSLFNAPRWLQMDTLGNIFGTIDTNRSFSISILAKDKYDHKAIQTVNVSMHDTLSSVSDDLQNALHISTSPNPFTSGTTVSYDLDEDAYITIEIINPQGSIIKTLTKDYRVSAGQNKITWDGNALKGSQCSSGLYFCRLIVQSANSSKQNIITKKLIKL